MTAPTWHRVCGVEGCDEPHYGRGFCRPHFMRWWRTGNPEPTRATHRTKVIPRRWV